ncbi:HIT domain-containing protein, partial [bacterium]|nr:HIT domain-containing protein [bacterium]
MDRVYAPWRSKYFTMSKDAGCLFCNVQDETEDAKVGILKRGKHWFIILNTFPYTSGHIMVVANRHINNFGEITEKEGKELVRMIADAEYAVDSVYHPEGLNVGVN